MTYDVLGKERHKAVCELRKLRDDIDNFSPTLYSYYNFTLKLLKIFEASDYCWNEGLMELCDRLIHLLGGDEETPMTYDVLGNQRHKAVRWLEERKTILGMTKTEILGDLGKAVTNDPNFDPSDIDHLDLMWSTLIHLLGGKCDAQRGCIGGAGGCDHSHEQIPFVGYDVLSNERHEAVCELRKLDLHQDSVMNNQTAIANAIGVDFEVGELFSDAMRRRLIHLLGGDEIVENAENYNLDSEPDAQNDENGDFCESNHMTITDELRTYAEECFPGPHNALIAIADRIDEQFARICEQQERVLQDTIGEMQDEIDRQKDLRDKNAKVAEDAIHSGCMYFDLLRDAARDYKALQDKLNLVFGMWVSATDGEAQ